MKIAIITPYFYPKIGGLESYAFNLAKQMMRKYGHEVVVITSNHVSRNRIEDNIEGIRIISMPYMLKVSNSPINPFWYWQIKKLLRAEKVDVVNVHLPVPFIADVAAYAAKALKIPVVVTYHAGSMKKGLFVPDLVIGIYEKHFLPRLLKLAVTITSVYPPFVQSVIPSRKDSIVFTPPGVDTTIFKPANTVQLKNPTILFVGRLEKSSSWKGIDTLLEATKIARRSMPNLQLKLVGDGDAVDDLKRMTKDLDIVDAVSFEGILRGEELAKAYRSTNALILPSRGDLESFGMVLIEAMACGTPVIGSRTGGISKTISDTGGGVLVRAGDIRELANAIVMLVGDEREAAKLARNGLQKTRELFSWSRLATEYHSIFINASKTDRLNIVHISAYYPPHLGGLEQVSYDYVQREVEAGHRVSVVTSTNEGDPTSFMLDNVSQLRSFEMFHMPIIPGLLNRLLHTPRGALFHVHAAQPGIPEVALIASKIRRIPMVVHVHADLGPSGRAGKLLPLYKKLFFGFVLRHADRVIVLNATYRDLVIDRYKVATDKIKIVPNGVDERFFDNAKVSYSGALGTRDHPIKLLFVGRLTVEKNVPMLMDSVVSSGLFAEFTIVGSGELEDEIRDKAKTIQSEKVSILMPGRKMPEELRHYYADADILLLGSDYESQSLVVLEAMASATPVIVADVPAVNLTVGDSGMLVKKDEVAFAEAICLLAGDPSHRQVLAAKGRKNAHLYDWASSVSKIEEIYRTL